jgi:hypothetical protein
MLNKCTRKWLLKLRPFLELLHLLVGQPFAAITFGANAWHTTSDTPVRAKGVATKLTQIQNKCLRIVGGAYKSTPTRSLETETFVPPIDIQLDYIVARFQSRLQNSGQLLAIRQACAIIKDKLKKRRGRRKSPSATPGQRREAWFKQWTDGNTRRQQQETTGLDWKKIQLYHWKERWKQGQARHQGAADDSPAESILKLHAELRKAESSTLIQIRTACIGLAAFLRRMRVPGIDTSRCRCEEGNETPEHVALYCPEEEGRRDELRAGGALDYRWLTGTPKGAKILSRWFIQSGRLGQFSLARDLLY